MHGKAAKLKPVKVKPNQRLLRHLTLQRVREIGIRRRHKITGQLLNPQPKRLQPMAILKRHKFSRHSPQHKLQHQYLPQQRSRTGTRLQAQMIGASHLQRQQHPQGQLPEPPIGA
jgi:hypothetical protein